MSKISKRTVDAAAPAEGRYILWDDALKGFGLLVLPSGVKSYFFNYRNAFNRERRLTIGKHGGGMTPEVARSHAEAHQRAAKAGADPLAQRSAMRAAPTLGDLFDLYLSSEAFSKKALSTQAIDKGRIAHHLRPLLGKTAVPALRLGDVERAHKAIAGGRTALNAPSGKKGGRFRITGGDGTARMSVRLFRSILAWGERQGIVSAEASAAAKNVDVGRDGRRTAILDTPAAYGRLFRTLDRLCDPSTVGESEGLVRREVADAIRIIALTGARRGEVLGLKWGHVDLGAGVVTLPAAAHKTGRSTGDPRVIGLPALAAAILARQPKGAVADLVFRPARGGQRMDLTKAWRAVCKAAELPPELGLHGLRHSLASHMAMQGAAASEIMTALGHRDMATSQKYVHWALDRRQALAEKAAKLITEAIESGDSAVAEDGVAV